MTLNLLGLAFVLRFLLPDRAEASPASTNTLAITAQGSQVTITFGATLQAARTLAGPWIDLTNVASPLIQEATNSHQFYRTQAAPTGSIFADSSVVDLTVSGPLQQHFELAFAGTPDGIFPPKREKPYFDGTVRVGTQELPISLRVRGNSSLQECPFPKLKFKVAKENRPGTPFADAREVGIGTHCAEGGRGNVGRLRDERAAFREALAYEAMNLLGFTTPRVRRARIEYRDTAPPSGDAPATAWPITRNAFLREDIEVVAERLGGTALSDEELAALPHGAFDEQLVIDLQFLHALLGNWDFALAPGDEGVRNTDVIKMADGSFTPVAGDFDLASWVTGEVRRSSPNDYHPELQDVEREALYQIEQIRGRVPAARFLAAAARFEAQRTALESLINAAGIDDAGRANALRHGTAFFDAIHALAQ